MRNSVVIGTENTRGNVRLLARARKIVVHMEPWHTPIIKSRSSTIQASLTGEEGAVSSGGGMSTSEVAVGG